MKRDFELGYFVLRLATAVDLLLHGVIRLAGHYDDFLAWLLKTFATAPIPEFMITITARVIPPLELLLGLFLLIGFKTRETVLVASLTMIGFIAGSCLIQNWELVSLQLFYIVIYAALLAFRSHNRILVLRD